VHALLPVLIYLIGGRRSLHDHASRLPNTRAAFGKCMPCGRLARRAANATTPSRKLKLELEL
jgi:hypothetical protein